RGNWRNSHLHPLPHEHGVEELRIILFLAQRSAKIFYRLLGPLLRKCLLQGLVQGRLKRDGLGRLHLEKTPTAGGKDWFIIKGITLTPNPLSRSCGRTGFARLSHSVGEGPWGEGFLAEIHLATDGETGHNRPHRE